ncbi:four helix bundle protein [Labilibaculum sp. K2S]|uniref:four helix bundle protein n=1 Tax=Labilibaculum sp. K2S TaxID=3056386 RepID=UPI0025A4B741|nr:four helix bundle protein [Labilibaculum sp. K2S]MDM8161128.1 four helix bundle protein [Labilibaculum sp. K2S]
MNRFKDLIVWQKSRTLVKEVYILTNELPSDERFGMVSQIRRCAVSIPSNIAEGCGRNTNADFARFLDISNGSSYELESLLILSIDLNYIQRGQFDAINLLIQEIQKMIFKLKESLK